MPKARLATIASAKPGRPIAGMGPKPFISGQQTTRCTVCIASML